ncbi:unnamed protein product [Lepeophtheirus salmonis]|uniref:(salmon louse) hypothetical protein n=1 Tax=Lepeophtheirus salmonis TaxID=72036 RepID=A0A7R8D2Y7_LEPSM|nr:unnamed protein product [Lepeophtheirus salmonis]CAF3006019.1 unnamed protein product [Lepeophtheirus salmonis]
MSAKINKTIQCIGYIGCEQRRVKLLEASHILTDPNSSSRSGSPVCWDAMNNDSRSHKLGAYSSSMGDVVVFFQPKWTCRNTRMQSTLHGGLRTRYMWAPLRPASAPPSPSKIRPGLTGETPDRPASNLGTASRGPYSTSLIASRRFLRAGEGRCN